MFYIKLNEATAARRRIPVLLSNSSDGYTPATGVTSATLFISKNGTVSNGAGSLVEIGSGQYYYECGASEIDTLGWISLKVCNTNTFRDYDAIAHITAYDAYNGWDLGLARIPYISGAADVFLVPRAELAATPSFPVSLSDAIAWIFELSRNRTTVESGIQRVFKDDQTTVLASGGLSDDGVTFTRTEFI